MDAYLAAEARQATEQVTELSRRLEVLETVRGNQLLPITITQQSLPASTGGLTPPRTGPSFIYGYRPGP